MLKKKVLCFVLSLIFILSVSSATFADDSDPVVPTLKLSVQQSPLAVYPPLMIYTAQLNTLTTPGTAYTVEFYNIVPGTVEKLVYIGSAPVDSTGKAVLGKQMNPGVYTSIAKVVLSYTTVWSNRVDYKVI